MMTKKRRRQSKKVRLMAQSNTDRALTKELARRRVWVFFAILVAAAFSGQLGEESDIFLHALDEYVLVALAVVALVVLAVMWKKQALGELRKQHNILLVLFVIMLVFKLYAVSVEFGDPQDFGNEIPGLIILIIAVANRFA